MSFRLGNLVTQVGIVVIVCLKEHHDMKDVGRVIWVPLKHLVWDAVFIIVMPSSQSSTEDCIEEKEDNQGKDQGQVLVKVQEEKPH